MSDGHNDENELFASLQEMAQAVRQVIDVGLKSSQALTEFDREVLIFAVQQAVENLEWSAEYVTRVRERREAARASKEEPDEET